MNDEQIFLANAYLDGELTADERSVAETDPAVMAEVAELRALQTGLRDVPPPTTDARESAIGAAMAEFRAAPPVAAADTPPAPIPLRRRPWYTPALTAAAAVVGIGLLAAILTQVPSRDDDAGDDAASEVNDMLVVEDAADDGDADAADDGMAEAPAEAANRDDSGDTAIVAGDDMAEDAAEMEVGGGEDTGADTADMADMATSDAGGSVPYEFVGPGSSPEEPITDESDLAAFGAQAIELIEHGEGSLLGATPETSCDAIVRAEAYVDVGAGVVLALVAIDDDLRVVTAIDPDTCRVLLEVDAGG